MVTAGSFFVTTSEKIMGDHRINKKAQRPKSLRPVSFA